MQAAHAANTGVPVGPEHAQAGKVQGTATEWLSYGGDKAGSKHSPLAQIDKDNFDRLRVAWTWRSAEEEVVKANSHLRTWAWEATPLMADRQEPRVQLAGASVPTAFAFSAIGASWADQPILVLLVSYVLPILLLPIALYLMRLRRQKEMSTLVMVLRTVSLLAFAGPMLLRVTARRREPKTRGCHGGAPRASVVANLAAFGSFFPLLLIFSGSSEGSMALPLALSGCLLALGGAALVLRSRAELGPAWSLPACY